MKSALVTGANKGIGFEIVKQLAQKGFYVYLACRSLENGAAAVAKLNAGGLTNLEVVELDVTSQQSVDAARAAIGAKTSVLDILINNAGIAAAPAQPASTAAAYQTIYDTNVFGVVRVTEAFLDLLKASSAPRIVNVSSAMASLTLAADIEATYYPQRYDAYQSSKSALNMYTVNLAYTLKDTPFKVNAVCPGYTQTDLTGYQGTSTPEQAAGRIVKYALIGEDGPTAKFFSEEYFADTVCPW